VLHLQEQDEVHKIEMSLMKVNRVATTLPWTQMQQKVGQAVVENFPCPLRDASVA
jgi:hypothetical protein